MLRYYFRILFDIAVPANAAVISMAISAEKLSAPDAD